MPDEKTNKKTLRQSTIARRNCLSSTTRHAKSLKIIEHLNSLVEFQQAQHIFCYIAYLSEVETISIIEDKLAQAAQIAVPKIISSTKMIAAPLKALSEIMAGQQSIPTTITSQEDTKPFDVVIVPGVAFTKQGERLGYGRGYYDRWFTKHPPVLKIGLGFEVQVVNSLPTEPYDINLDILITETNHYDLRSNTH